MEIWVLLSPKANGLQGNRTLFWEERDLLLQATALSTGPNAECAYSSI